MSTDPKDRQLWFVSTMGNAESAWFHEWVDRGRESSSNPESGLAYFEWAAPEGADAYDPEVARVATEKRPGRYPTVVVTVPRQSGKTTLMRALKRANRKDGGDDADR